MRPGGWTFSMGAPMFSLKGATEGDLRIHFPDAVI